MALWRDPLDELIADLERALPSELGPVGLDYQKALLDLQDLVAEVLFPRRDRRVPSAATGQISEGVRGGGK